MTDRMRARASGRVRGIETGILKAGATEIRWVNARGFNRDFKMDSRMGIVRGISQVAIRDSRMGDIKKA